MSQESEIAYAQGSPRYDTEMMDKLLEESNTEESGDTYTFPPSLIQPSYTTEGKSPSPRSFSKKSKSLKSPKWSPPPEINISPYSQPIEALPRTDSIFDSSKGYRRRDVNSLQNLYNGITSPFGLYIVDQTKSIFFELNDQREYSLDELITIRKLVKIYAPPDYGDEEINFPISLQSRQNTYTYDNGTTITRLYKLTDTDADNIIATMLSNKFHLSLICISLVNPTVPALSIGYGYSSGYKEEGYFTPDGTVITVKQQLGGIYVKDQVSPTPQNPSVLAGAKILRINDIHRINDFLQKGSIASCTFKKLKNGNYQLFNIIISGDDIPTFAESPEIDRIEKKLRSMGLPPFYFINRYNCVRIGSRKLLNLLLQCGQFSLPGDCPEVDKERFYQLRDLIYKLQQTRNETKHLKLLDDLHTLIDDIDKTLGITELPSHYTEAQLSQLSQLETPPLPEEFQSVQWESFGGRKTKNKKRKYKYSKKNGKKRSQTRRSKKTKRRNKYKRK